MIPAMMTIKTRVFPASGQKVSEVGLGTWQLGGAEWGGLAEDEALATLRAAADAGVTFFDTADIYGSGRSETLIGRFLQDLGRRRKDLFIATKFGRRAEPGWPANFQPDTIRRHTEASLQRLGVQRLDLTQSHCIPPDLMRKHDVWRTLEKLRDEKLIAHFGASVESVEEALACIERGAQSLQVIFNIFRRKPAETIFEKAAKNKVAVIVRLPLASGLLSGRMAPDTRFDAADHRTFNRNGERFNVGETFAGLPFDKGLGFVDQLRKLHDGYPATLAQWAIRWCLDFDAVTTVIPGARRPQQARENAAASHMPPIPLAVHEKLKHLHDREVAPLIRGPY